MKIIIYKEDFVEGISKASNLIPTKTGAAYLRTIWFKTDMDSVRIMSTDSNVEFTGEYRAEIVEEGLIGTPGRKISDLIRKLKSGPITMYSDEKNDILYVQQEKRHFKLPLSESSWFPELDEFPEENALAGIPGIKFKDILEKSLFCISDDDTMQGMTCLKIAPGDENQVEFCAFNGHQLSLYIHESSGLREILPEKGIMIAKKYLMDLRKWVPESDIQITITDSKIFFRTLDKKECFSLPLNMHQFPNYRDFINNYSEKLGGPLVTTKNDLMDSLERILIFNTDSQMSTLMRLGQEEIYMTSTAVDSGEAEEVVGCSYQGNLKEVVFNTKSLLEILGHIDDDNVVMKFSGPIEPCRINGENDQKYYVMTMPVQIEEETYYTEEEMD
ncbi:DNA polymerase III, beta subunit [Desulfonatronospira thiodismutans ASO3-1]|uniref:Beta sliding clamp n=1 Tax=Desulfonatronospira thiodismutans ASO3-1 TaxID=555779 RepID=D6SP75_9BACT|nr:MULTISPECIES: DNA polymerase III subunit beta [Desulfonatronospira]EFI34551.1 DNA polymerase III, beta subunit [Desulfonatronospira thiodismutans ASO3-1]RQD75146.1 MAG: DNA polymerase III subunit beta [Desulfonatronospira sp. MSAO_Bac3]